MDEQTTLVIFGDHGMTSSGNHGGNAEDEMRSVLFAYQKTPFAQSENFSQLHDSYKTMNKEMKQSDLASIVSSLLDLPLPFSNVGVFHPAFFPHHDLRKVHAAFMKNLEQFQTYVEAYCAATEQKWCADEISSFAANLTDFRKTFDVRRSSNAKIVEHIGEMHAWANKKYSQFSAIWTDMNQLSFAIGIIMNLWLIVFHCVTSFQRPKDVITDEVPEANVFMLAGILICWASFIAHWVVPDFPCELSAIFTLVMTFSQSLKQMQRTRKWLCHRVFRAENRRPKPMLYKSISGFMIVLLIVMQFVDSMIQECDYVTDGFLLLILCFFWMTKPAHLRHQDYIGYLTIIACIKFAYFLDRESSLNFNVDKTMAEWRESIQAETKLLTLVPLALMLPLEWKVVHSYNLGWLQLM